jgi:hypothetical protein
VLSEPIAQQQVGGKSESEFNNPPIEERTTGLEIHGHGNRIAVLKEIREVPAVPEQERLVEIAAGVNRNST